MLAVGSLLSAQPVLEAPLGPSGEITEWLVLGDIPIPDATDKEKWAEVTARDLLAAAGGEAGMKPVGGQEVKLPEGDFIWKVLPVTMRLNSLKRLPRPGWGPVMRPLILRDPQGLDIENASVYLFCRLLAEKMQKVSLLFGSDDSAKIYLNGTLVYEFVGQRSAGTDSEEIELALNQGSNELLVRVDNYVFSGGVVGRLLAGDGAVPKDVRVQIPADKDTPEYPQAPEPPTKTWSELVAEIPALAPLPHEELLGARLTRTMALLQESAQTRRPVRIVFYGQSITDQHWTNLLVERLRERYPKAIIEMENHSLGGWNVWRLMRAMVHGTLQSRPDLVVFFAYSGSCDDWERVLSGIRRETNADIMLRSSHWSGRCWEAIQENPRYPGASAEETMLRYLAQKYDCELVECRREWCEYGVQNHMEDYRSDVLQGKKNLVIDGIHLNDKGNILMAQLHERHFRMNFNCRSGWADPVRWYEALRPIDDKIGNEIVFKGDGWKPYKAGSKSYVESSSSDDSLSLTFTGTRADVVLAPGAGAARILIDGKKPAGLNLYYGTLPKQKVGSKGAGNVPSIMRYFTGPDMIEEVWELRWTHASKNGRKFRYTLTGSKTGFDGEGNNESDFVSNSGRIRMYLDDLDIVVPLKGLSPDDSEELVEFKEPIVFTFRILPLFKDEIRWVAPTQSVDQTIDWNYVTVVDGLPCGDHELTIVPSGDGSIAIRGIEVYRPPLAGK